MTPFPPVAVRAAALLVLALFVSACSAGRSASGPSLVPASASGSTPEEKLLDDAHRDLVQHRPEEAIATLDRVIGTYNASYRGGRTDVYCARSMQETLAYMAMARAGGRDAVAIDATWADALYLKGYALIELGRMEEARRVLESARTLSPKNSQYISELAHTWQAERQWEKSLALFREAEQAAKISPDELRTHELTRALRGQGFALIELGRLDEAEAKFEASLAADRHDLRAKGELAYIEKLRSGD